MNTADDATGLGRNRWLARQVRLQELTEDSAWRASANCIGVDPAVFFPNESPHSYHRAVAICAACEVREPCLNYALTLPEMHGIWGGMGEKERRRLRRRPRNRKVAV